MSYKAMYAYAWDLAEQGVAATLDEIRDLGLDTVTLAASYHAGKFLRPKGRNGKIYFPDDGTVYFHARPEYYGVIKPIENNLVEEDDILAEVCAREDIAANAWLVLLHNTRLGAMHPQATVQNAFGDRYVYSLCPSAPEARAYAIALCRDVTESYGLSGISLETPGFLPYVHGFHHEFALVRQNVWLNNRLGLCFCGHCRAGAAAAGIDVERLRRRIAEDVAAYLDGDLDLADDMAEVFWLADTREGELSAFLIWRSTVVTSLVAEIRAAVRPDVTVAIIPSVARPTAGAWYEGSDLAALAKAAGTIEACFYESGPERVRAEAWDVTRRLAGVADVRGILRPAHPDLRSKADVIAAVAALRAAGIENIAFYNYGHLRRASLGWIKAALAQA